MENTQKTQGGVPTVLAVIIVVVLIAAGAYFALNERMAPVSEEALTAEYQESAASTDERLKTLESNGSSSTEVNSIESDFNNADLDSMDADLESLDRELGY